MKTEKALLTTLKPYPGNPRKHTELQIDEMVKSITQFGQYRPIVVDEGNVILAGHGIAMALTKMGRKDADVLHVVGLTEAQKTKLVLADNKLAELGTPDYDAMFDLLQGLKGDLDIPGFDADSLNMLIANVDGAFESVGADAVVQEGGQGIDSPEVKGKGRMVECPYCHHTFDLKKREA